MAIEDLIEPEEQIYYYLNLGRYHARWKDLSEVDFQTNLTAPRGRFISEEVVYNWDIPVISREEKAPMPEEMQKYLDLMVELCKENNIELVLYTAPFNSLYNEENTRQDLFARQRIFNGIDDYAEDKNLRYYNLFYEMEGIGLNGETDYMDSQHFNASGQTKVTRYMAEMGYLSPEA